MKRIFSMAALVALATGGAATLASAAATVTTALDVNSAYVWRGITANNGLVLQPSIDVSANGFGVNVWANYDASDYDNTVERSKFSEVDLTASYTFKIGTFDASVGVIEYTFPRTKTNTLAENTAEIFAGLSKDLGAGFTASSKVYYDFDSVNDFYVTAGLGYSYSINDKTTLGLNGMISYAGENFAEYWGGGTNSGFFNYMLTASIKYMVTDAFGIGANINYTDSMDNKVLADAKVDTKVFGGVSLTYTF